MGFSSLTVLCLALVICMFAAGGVSDAKVKIKTEEPGLCYTCHDKLKEDTSDREHIHVLFKQGKCSTCHDPHVSNHEDLLSNEINSLCLNCHEKLRSLLKKKAMVHTVMKAGLCTDCHYAHSGNNKGLLVKAKNELCWDCHDTLKDKLRESTVHPLFAKGSCFSCHNAHVSAEEDLLIAKPNAMCKECHGPRCTAYGVSITFATKDSDCTSCHSGHSSRDKGLLGPFGHESFLLKDCGVCHNPIQENKSITLIRTGKQLCLACHEKTSPFKYIDDDVHVEDTASPCLKCHNAHASKKALLTKDESSVCLTCHENTEQRTVNMEKIVKAKCEPVNQRRCFDCHMKGCSSEQPLYFSGDPTFMCTECHAAEHRAAHPIGKDVIDPRNGQPMTCITCHSMHSSRAEYMLTFDRKRALCIQCHKK
jgi:predicted CXXCH cytochrome family protein